MNLHIASTIFDKENLTPGKPGYTKNPQIKHNLAIWLTASKLGKLQRPLGIPDPGKSLNCLKI